MGPRLPHARPLPAVLLVALALSVACVAGPQPAGEHTDDPTDDRAERPSYSSHGQPLDLGNDASILRPAPTEHRLDDDAERRHKNARKEWMRSRHRAPDGVDTKPIEIANGDAQRRKRNTLAGMQAAGVDRWIERGSRNQAGRIHVAAHSPDGTALYAGSSKGGVWRGGLDGTNWEPLGDNIYGGAHWLAVVSGVGPVPDIMLRATDGGQIHRSVDDGATWVQPAGIPASMNSVRRVLVTSDGSETIFMVVRFWDGGQLKNNLLRSTDKGASFQFSNGMNTWEGDVWAPRDGGGAIYCLKLDKVQVSVDNGSSWSDVGSLPVSANGGELAGSEAGAPRLWAVLDTGAGRELYRSDDAGVSWIHKQSVSDYWGTLRASIIDPDLFAWGGVEVWRTTDGGNNFAIVNNWGAYYGDPANKLHADIPGMDVVPDGVGGEIWYVCTDGGLFNSTDGLASVSNLSLNGLGVSQYYSTHTSVVNPLHVGAGAQDQGYQWADQPAPGGGTALDFDQLISGDYGHLTSTDGSHDYLYMTYPGFILIHKGEDNPSLYSEDFPATNHDWLPSVVADPWAKIRFFFCGQQIYRYERDSGSNTWSHILWSTQDFATVGGEYVTQLVFSPVNTNKCWAATNYGRMWNSDDHAVTWTLSPDSGPSSHYFYGTALVASAYDSNTVYAGGSGYGSPAVYRTTDGGLTWQPWGDGLPDTLVYALAEAPDGSALYCGTETGAYERPVGGATWVDITDDDAPVTTYWSAEAVASENVIRFGTYGRGIWDYQLTDDCNYTAYGVGLGGANSVILDTASSTHKGTDHVLEITNGPASAGGLLFYSQDPANLPIYGGFLLTDPATWILFGIVVDGAGELTLPLSIPDNPLAVGVPINFQVALQDGPGFDDYVFSNGLSGVICE